MMGKRLCCSFMMLCLLTVGALLLTSPVGAADKGAPKPTAKDKCPVCGMFVAKYTDWMSVVVFKDGSRAFFDGPKDMFKYLLDLKRYNPSKKEADIDLIAVTDYYLVSTIDARKAWYVLGSDVFGPMGKELVPLAKESEAKEFMKDHKGQRIVKFSEVTTEVMKVID
jgi:copper chaperone NosL